MTYVSEVRRFYGLVYIVRIVLAAVVQLDFRLGFSRFVMVLGVLLIDDI